MYFGQLDLIFVVFLVVHNLIIMMMGGNNHALFDPGYIEDPFKGLCQDYPDSTVYPSENFRVERRPIFHRGWLDGSDHAGGPYVNLLQTKETFPVTSKPALRHCID